MNTRDCFVSVVAPLENDSTIIGDFIDEVSKVLRTNYTNYELILIDDGSADNTSDTISVLLGKYECIRFIRLSRKFGQEIAITAGLDSAIGDFVVVMIPNTDPPHLIPGIVERSRVSSGVVYGISKTHVRGSFLAKTGRKLFYWYCNKILKLKLVKNATQFRILSRQSVNAIVQIKDRYRYLHIFSSYVGYGNESFEYQPINRVNKSKSTNFYGDFNLAIDIIIANSTHPLRFVTWMGLLASILNLFYIGYIFAIYFFKDQVAEGWTTASLQNAGMFFFIFLILTVISEYIGRLLEESKRRPLYYVLEEKNSNVDIKARNRMNVVKESTPFEL